MYEFYNKTDPKTWKVVKERLKSLYSDIPETTGCMENIAKEGGCAAWCCLTPEVRVYTSRGLKPISEVKKDWYVHTRKGLRRVIKVASKHVSESITVVESRYGRKMRMTSDHKVLVDSFARKGREKPSNPVWVEAGDLIPKVANQAGHYLIFPKIKLLDYSFHHQMDLSQPQLFNSEQDDRKDCYNLTISAGKYKDYVETACDFRVPISNIYTEQYEGLVYDIEVEDEHEFFTECGVVHNCEHQNPSVFYSEFLLSWGKISGSWTKKAKADLVVRALRNYFNPSVSKGCVFWDKTTKLCQQHETRPYNCRIYGQRPEEEFKPRYEKLKVLYPEADVRNQCDLVKSPKPPTKAEIDEWFNQVRYCEHDVGVHHSLHHDGDGGSYRSYHDHILLTVANEVLLRHISRLRKSGTVEEQEKFVAQFEADLQRDLKL